MADEGHQGTTQRYDVFLSHTSGDKDAVEHIARRLRTEAQLEPFLDKWHLIPGNAWQEELEQALNQSRTCAVFLGPADLSAWTKIFISVMTLVLTDMLRTEPLLVETSTNRTRL